MARGGTATFAGLALQAAPGRAHALAFRTTHPRALRFVDQVFHLDKGLLLEGHDAERASEAIRLAAGGHGTAGGSP